MADDHNNASPRARRSSFAGETLASLFAGHRGSISRPSNETNTPGPITSAAAQAQRRRLSLTTLGLSGSPHQSSPFGSYHSRRESYGTAGSDTIDESAIEDDAAPGPNPTPFARRMSFGARALRDVRTGGGGGGGNSPDQNGNRKPSITVASTEHNALATQKNGTISNRDIKARGWSTLHSLPPSEPFALHIAHLPQQKNICFFPVPTLIFCYRL